MKLSSVHSRQIRIGILADEPIRVAGLVSIFDLPAQAGQAQMIPVIGSLRQLLASPEISYVVVDLHSLVDGMATLEAVRSARPDLRLIVIGPEGDDEMVLHAITAGARAYLGRSSPPGIVRKAIDEVTAGSIWAPRYLLSRLIDRLLRCPDPAPAHAKQELTPREEQVMRLILVAKSTREIARELGIEQRTVKSYVARLMRKAGADNRVKLTFSALGRSLLNEEAAVSEDFSSPYVRLTN